MPTAPEVVAHLYRRAGFGANAAQIAALAPLDLAAIVDGLLDRTANPADPTPAILSDPNADGWQRWALSTQAWLDRMATSPTPLVEKMALFWHGHFVSGDDKINDMAAMWAQVGLYRAQGMADVRTLAKAMAVTPAMLRYLDNASNVVGAPNQNFARELLELFLLGVGHYTEDDIAAAARAWTGHTVTDAGAYVFVSADHDGDPKTFLGTTGNLNGPDTIDVILDHPTLRVVCARFLVRNLWTYFAHPQPPIDVEVDLAAVLVTNGFAITPLLRALFLRPEFYLPAALDGLVRSPIGWCVALMRATGLPAAELHPEWWLDGMGQRPFVPPNVAGWKANAYWISTNTALNRADHARYLAWKASEAGVLATTPVLGVAAAVDAALVRFGVDRVSVATRSALTAWLTAQRAVPFTGWLEPQNLMALVALCPEMQLA